MEAKRKQQPQHKREGKKEASAALSSSARSSDGSNRAGAGKGRRNGGARRESTTDKAGGKTAQKRIKTKGTTRRPPRGGRAVPPGSKKRPAAAGRSTATPAANKTNVTGQKALHRKQIAFESEDLRSLRHRLASTQEALQKVLQFYGSEYFRRSLGGKSEDAAEATPETLVQREIFTLKRLLYLISGGQVPLPVPPDFFYVLTKQYLEGTWTDICAAAAKQAPGDGDTETPAAAGRTEVTIETVHEIPPAAERNAFRGSLAATGRTESKSIRTAQPLPTSGGVSVSNVSQIEEVEQLIRVEIEGEEPMEWRDVYRLPEEGPPVLVSSSANERACAASISEDTLKREAMERLHEEGMDKQPPSPHVPASPLKRLEEVKEADARQQEEQLEQLRDAVFIVQPQHAAARTWKGRGEGSDTSQTPTEEVFRTEDTRKKSQLEEAADTPHDRLPSISELEAGTVLRQQQRHPNITSFAPQSGEAPVIEEQPCNRKAEAGEGLPSLQSRSCSRFAVPVRETPTPRKDTNYTSIGSMYVEGRNTIGSAPIRGPSGSFASSRLRSMSSISSRSGLIQPRQGTREIARNGSRAGLTQERNSERVTCRTAAIASLLSEDYASLSSPAEDREKTPSGGAVQRRKRQTDETSSERCSLAGERYDSRYFVPAPARGLESVARNSSSDAVGVTALPLAAAAGSRDLPQRSHQKSMGAPLFVGGSASPLDKAPMRAAGAPELAAVRAALAAAATAAAGAEPDTHTAYIFDVPPYTGVSPPRSSFYYTPPQYPASPPPSPVFPIFPSGRAPGRGPEHTSISPGKPGSSTVFIPPSAAYPYGALIPGSFVFPPPPPSPASPVFGSWERHDKTSSAPQLLGTASTVEKGEAAGASRVSQQRSESNPVIISGSCPPYRDDVMTAGACVARAETTHKVTGEGKVATQGERDGEEIWDSSNSRKQKQNRDEATKSRGKLPSASPQANAHVSGYQCAPPTVYTGRPLTHCPAVFPQVLEDVKYVASAGGKAQFTEEAEKCDFIGVFVSEGTPHRFSGYSPEDQKRDETRPMNGDDGRGADDLESGYDEAAAAALGFRVYRYPARAGRGTYDVFETAAVQAVLLAHAQEMSVPVFWNKDGEPLSWPRVTVSRTASGTRRSQLSDKQRGREPHRHQPPEMQSVVVDTGEEHKHTDYFDTVPCCPLKGDVQQPTNTQQQQQMSLQRVDPLRFSPPEGPQYQRCGHQARNKSLIDKTLVSSRVGPPVSSPGSPEGDRKGIQSLSDDGSAESIAAVATVRTVADPARAALHIQTPVLPSSASSTMRKSAPVTPWCSLKDTLTSSYSRFFRGQLLPSACWAAVRARQSSLRSRSVSRIPISRIPIRKLQEQRRHWPDIQRMTIDRTEGCSRRSGTAPILCCMRRTPAEAVSAKSPEGDGERQAHWKSSGWYATASGIDRINSQTMDTIPRLINWKLEDNIRGLVARPQHCRTPTEAEFRMSERTTPDICSHSQQQLPIRAPALERLDSILKEASNLDARLQQVNGKVEKLLEARKRGKSIGV